MKPRKQVALRPAPARGQASRTRTAGPTPRAGLVRGATLGTGIFRGHPGRAPVCRHWPVVAGVAVLSMPIVSLLSAWGLYRLRERPAAGFAVTRPA